MTHNEAKSRLWLPSFTLEFASEKHQGYHATWPGTNSLTDLMLIKEHRRLDWAERTHRRHCADTWSTKLQGNFQNPILNLIPQDSQVSRYVMRLGLYSLLNSRIILFSHTFRTTVMEKNGEKDLLRKTGIKRILSSWKNRIKDSPESHKY